MAIYYFWGNDEYRLNQAVAKLRQTALDPAWVSFNYHSFPSEQPDAVTQALNQAMTPPFGVGQRLVWLKNTTLGQRCPEALLEDLGHTLPQVPETTVLLFTSTNKPDGRAKFTKLLQKHATVQEFSTIPPWKGDLLVKQVQQIAQEANLALAPDTAEMLAAAVGNDTRQLHNEIDKLALFWQSSAPLSPEAAADLVTVTTQNSLKLANAIREGRTGDALELLRDLLNRNESGLRIVATLVGQFRQWLWVKLMSRAGASHEEIAKAAELGNPKRVYFLLKEVRSQPQSAFQGAMFKLLELEYGLKSGADDRALLQTKVIEIAQFFS